MCGHAGVSFVSVMYVYTKNKKDEAVKKQSIKLLPWPCYQGDTEILSMSQGLCFHGNTYE